MACAPAETPPPPIDDIVLSPSEYALLTTAVETATRAAPVAVSATLSLSHTATLEVPFPLPCLTLHPRPHFPPALHAALLLHAVPAQHKAPHEALHVPLCALAPVLALLAASRLAPLLPPTLLRTALTLPATPVPTEPVASVVGALSPTPWTHLHAFQQTAVLHAIRHLRGRVLLADDMGLGKTLQALSIAQYYRLRPAVPTAVLVLCPAPLRTAWRLAIPRWLTVLSRTVHAPTSHKSLAALLRASARAPRDPWDPVPDLTFLVVGYDLLPTSAELLQGHFSIVIADEVHTLRNVHTARAQAALPLIIAADRRVLVSGTPALSRPAELYPLLRALLTTEGAPFMSLDDFTQRYCGGQPAASRAVSNADELNLLLSSVMVRRAKAEVRHELPPKTRRQIVVEIAPPLLRPLEIMQCEVRELAQCLADPMTESAARGEFLSRRKALVSLLYLKTADLKIPGVVTRVRQLLRAADGPKKFLVFAHHLHVLDAVQVLAERECAPFVRIDGETPAGRRHDLVTEFQESNGVRLAILSLAVAGTGLTLTAADVVVFAELSWVPSVLAQAEDRAHRLGREGPVTVEYVFAPGTVDDMMWGIVKDKLDVLNKAVDGSQLKRKEAFDVSNCSSKRIRISEVEVQTMLTDTINAIEGEKVDQRNNPVTNAASPEDTNSPYK